MKMVELALHPMRRSPVTVHPVSMEKDAKVQELPSIARVLRCP